MNFMRQLLRNISKLTSKKGQEGSRQPEEETDIKPFCPPPALPVRYRAFLHRENPTFKIWQRLRFVVVFRSMAKAIGN